MPEQRNKEGIDLSFFIPLERNPVDKQHLNQDYQNHKKRLLSHH